MIFLCDFNKSDYQTPFQGNFINIQQAGVASRV